jgi:glutamate dehydrogenase/leucine dehydrogenase
VVCDFERTQGLSNDYWSLDEVRARLTKRMERVYREARQTGLELKIPMRRAAWALALKKIRAAMLWRGWS